MIELFAEEARLVAETEGAVSLISAPQVRMFEGRADWEEALEEQDRLRQTRQVQRETQSAILDSRIVQLERQIVGYRAEILARNREHGLISEELEGLQKLLDSGLVAKSRVLALQREQSSLVGAREALTANIARTEFQIGETRLEKSRLKTEFQTEVQARLAAVRAEIGQLVERREILTDQIARLEIKAPRNGRVMGVQTHTIGGVIQPGEPIMFIVPEDDRLVASLRIQPQDIDKVWPGQSVTLRLTAFNQNQTPALEGTLSWVSADAMLDPDLGITFYTGMVELPAFVPGAEQIKLIPGMPVDAMIKTDRRTVLSYLLKPAQDAMTKTFRD